MTIRHLKIFIAVAETGKMSLAAKKLYLAQPTISQAIHELEEHYHTQLFDRLSKRLYITDAGQELLSLARNAVRSFDDLELRMENYTRTEHFRIGATVTVGSCLLPSLLEDFRERRNRRKALEIRAGCGDCGGCDQKSRSHQHSHGRGLSGSGLRQGPSLCRSCLLSALGSGGA